MVRAQACCGWALSAHDYPERIPSIAPREDIRITEAAPIIQMETEPGAAELVVRRWSRPGPTGKLDYNCGPDIAPNLFRQIVVLGRDEWTGWLSPAVPASEILRPARAGTLGVARVR